MMPFVATRIRSLRATCAAVLFFAFTASCPGDVIQLDTRVTVRFADVETGREILIRRDDFVAALSPKDRQIRMQSAEAVAEADYLAFVGRSVRSWTPEETNRLTGVLQTLSSNLSRWQLPFPTNLWLIKTSGEEEFHSCYTRQNAIVFPAAEAAGRLAALRHVVLHELFHVLSRNDAAWRRALYGVIGFQRINEIALPDNLGARKITNPDGVENGWRIGVTNRGEALSVVPILLAGDAEFNPFDSFRLLAVKPGDAGWIPLTVDGHPRLLKPGEVTGWYEQIGRNTGYIIHPDEILADNFVRLIDGGTNVPTPRILTEMADIFRRRSKR